MVNLGSFGNEYVTNSQILFPLAIALFFLLVIFGYFYNSLMDSLKGKEHTSLYVVGGAMVTIGAAALISWRSALLFTVLFILDGVPMIVGEFRLR
jgi:predicted membrane channel-forming protein YqfA (hemolysin III family)